MPTYIRLTDYKSSDEKEQEFFNPENRYESKQGRRQEGSGNNDNPSIILSFSIPYGETVIAFVLLYVVGMTHPTVFQTIKTYTNP